MAGQRYVQLLQGHPFFDIAFLGASSKSACRTYREAVAHRWNLSTSIPSQVSDMTVSNIDQVDEALNCCDLIFSAVSSSVAAEWEFTYAKAGLPVVSNASAHRWEDDVPVIIPEINGNHLQLIESQQRNRGLKHGFVVVKPNCSLQSYVLPLAPLKEVFGLKRIVVTTMQALSGAGYPGVSAMDMIDNVIPFIPGEEEKSEKEPSRIFGRIESGQITSDSSFSISAHCNRVHVSDGHMACVSVEFEKEPAAADIINLWDSYSSPLTGLNLPSAPLKPILYTDEPARPQPSKDRMTGSGMVVTVGRLRECPVLHHRFVCLSHNTIRGAAGGGILIAELLVARGWIKVP
jgi:aspartate-semialdehyde dehydrogenase